MNKFKRFTSMMLALLLVFSSIAAFVACNEKDDESDSTVDTAESKVEITTEAEKDIHPTIKKKNYNDEFYLHILPDVNPVDCYWVEESSNEMLTEAVYARQRMVYDYLGVEVQGIKTGNYSQYIEPFKTAVKNKDGSVDTLISHVHTGIDGLIGENYLMDLNLVPGVELDSEHWNAEFMENISINDHMFLGYNNLNILYTYVVTYNKDMMDKYDDSFDETIYEMVDNYHWTLDKMISISNLAYIDITNDGKTLDDQFGISGLHWVPFCGFLHSSNINLVEMNEEGGYSVVVYNDLNQSKTSSLISILKDFAASNSAWFWPNGSDQKVSFTGGKSLMALSPSTSLPSYTNYELSFGVLPYPMFDEAQANVGYRSLQWGGYVCVPSYVEDLNMVGETIELLAYFSDNVREVYYEKLLGKQVADSPDDRRMLDLIWSSICSDFGQTYYSVVQKTSLLYMVPKLTLPTATQSIASFMASVDKSADKLFKAYLSKIK